MIPAARVALARGSRRSDVHIESVPIAEPNMDAALSALVRIVEEAAGNDPWSLVGAASARMQGADTPSPNLEFITTANTSEQLAEMLNLDVRWLAGRQLAAQRLHFLRDSIPVFVFGDAQFQGRYDELSPRNIPALWDALVRLPCGSVTVMATPLEWELLLAVVLDNTERAAKIARVLRGRSWDGRLLTRLTREGHVSSSTEEAVWQLLENGGPHLAPAAHARTHDAQAESAPDDDHHRETDEVPGPRPDGLEDAE